MLLAELLDDKLEFIYFKHIHSANISAIKRSMGKVMACGIKYLHQR